MKFSTVIVSALAAFASAAPAETQSEKRTALDISKLNNYRFSNQNFGYLGQINSLNFAVLTQLVTVNNFNAITAFQTLFVNQVFDINSLLQLQQLQMLIQFQQLGVLSAFDLSTLQIETVNLGMLAPIGSVNLGQFISGSNSLVPDSQLSQIQQIAQPLFASSRQ